jgi:hypothetical protein
MNLPHRDLTGRGCNSGEAPDLLKLADFASVTASIICISW